MRKSLLDSICSTRSCECSGAFARLFVVDVRAFADVGIAGLRGNVDGTIDRAQQHAQAAGVIAMFVSDEHGVEPLYVFADEREPARDLFGAEAGVNENTSFAGNDQNRIAR